MPAEVDVRFLAGEQQELVVGQPRAFGVQRAQLPSRSFSAELGRLAVVELGQMDDVDAGDSKDAAEVGHFQVRRNRHSVPLARAGRLSKSSVCSMW